MTRSTLTFTKTSLSYPSRERKGLPQQVLDSINFSVSSGEFVVIIGRSGSGKTSLLNLAAGFQVPTEGGVLLDGARIVGPGAERAVVFQDDALYPWFNARDNVAFPLKLRGLSKAERRARADALLALVALSHAADRRIWELSGGMRQRVGIARALASEPSFLLLDEPLGALDALTRTKMQGFLLDIWKKSGAGALLITHSIDEALLLATRIIVLSPNPGRIAATFETGFGAELLAGAKPETLRATPLFKSIHEQLTDLIHTLSPEEELAA
ncbi:taurine transport system ATP-binding protein [Pararhizobium capsulatum DSM 1112]|uniref:Taurine transport system ATP-binding protein n=1 Tax=Pararhizobium capsulatum DSM 1112 TaxID=1121113 RepID=A0ABU0BVI4_9HYPH|nr:ATP-binding cassette domain-containing protein [Pararhizobium capsulatum]MDQ0321681.1 taurine transport system ATP-binding protein [Pararhizobium capsulatum DSM 1112]